MEEQASEQKMLKRFTGFILVLLAYLAGARVLFGAGNSVQQRPSFRPFVSASNTAFVLSLNETRFERTANVLRAAGYNVTRVAPVPLTDPSLQVLAKFDPLRRGVRKSFLGGLSAQLSMRHAWLSALLDPNLAVAPDSYFLMFEDDATLDEHVQLHQLQALVHHAAQNSYDAGVFFAGLGCSWKCAGGWPGIKDIGAELWWVFGSMDVHFARCTGMCAHAYGIHAWRAQWLFDELQAASSTSDYFSDKPDYR